MGELRRVYDNMDDIPESYRDLFVQRDGKYVPNLTGPDPYSKSIDEFNRVYQARDNERKQREELQSKLSKLQERFGGDLDDARLEEITSLMQNAEDAEQRRLIDEKKFEEAAERKFHRQVTELTRQIEQLKAQMQTEQNKYNTLLDKHKTVKIQDALKSALLEAGADHEKLPWVLKAEMDKWELSSDTLEPEPVEWINGGREKVTATGADGNILTMSEHAKSLVRDNSWLSLASSGSGSVHQNGANTGGLYTIRESEVSGPGGTQRYQALREQAQKVGQLPTILPG